MADPSCRVGATRGAGAAPTSKAVVPVTAAMRSPLAPELPTLTETGLPGFDTYTRWGFMAPAGTPGADHRQVERRGCAYSRHAGDEGVLRPGGRATGTDTPEAFAALIKREIPSAQDRQGLRAKLE